MRWKTKARIQNIISLLPSSASYAAYYWVQRHFGGLRTFNPTMRLKAGINTWNRIVKQGHDPTGKVFFEVGTGRVPVVPLAFWLMGAGKTVTVDLNPYLKSELVAESLKYIDNNRVQILELFGGTIDRRRFNELLKFAQSEPLNLPAFLELCQIEYLAPGDAADTKLPEDSIDYHTSYTVFEHIPPKALKAILVEAGRVVRDTGLSVHRIDYSDHFSHSDKQISAINFLQYSDPQWDKIAGNRYMYMNRLRHDDYLEIFESAGQHILEMGPTIKPEMRQVLDRDDMVLDDRFVSKDADILVITGSWIVSRES